MTPRPDPLKLTREVQAPPDRVFHALTDPQELLRWWGGEGSLTAARVNLRPGGEYRFDLRGPGGDSAWIKGQYQIVEPPSRLVMTWFSTAYPDVRNTVEFHLDAMPAGTRVTVTQGGLAGRPDAYDATRSFWTETLSLLSRLA